MAHVETVAVPGPAAGAGPERVALVTGGSSGIGRATAAAFLAAGYGVAICARGGERLAAAERELSASGPVLAHRCDVSDPAEAAGLVAATLERFGRLDAVVNAHGVAGTPAAIEDLTPADWGELLAINLLGPIHVTRAAIPALRLTRGSVVNVSSLNAHRAEPLMAPYGVAKAGLESFTRYAAHELAADGIRVNTIAPGWIMTPMARPFLERRGLVGKPLGSMMMGRIGEPEEVAAVAVFLAGDGASYITGETIAVDGGRLSKLEPL